MRRRRRRLRLLLLPPTRSRSGLRLLPSLAASKHGIVEATHVADRVPGVLGGGSCACLVTGSLFNGTVYTAVKVRCTYESSGKRAVFACCMCIILYCP